ncbi:flagellar protein FlaF [Cohaesibacter sp. ES.047]|uniref:flagellar biosynthesis regulator FlaF n=1 Tax=Cohaesibacter sp. ES.047 TaxID=1798205 RepID=UPI000BB78926|nr:flagellar biosynthesis regulator FlaF [Cohaesibacter sp. ES.047]SNY94281.1 flagellar protein FlaF [Cohaesibacter sp. ES.047]
MYNQSAAKAYQQAGNIGGSPREKEAAMFLKAAAFLQRAKAETSTREDWDHALSFNRNVWTFIVGELMDDNHEMPAEIRQNIVNLGIFTFNQTLRIIGEPRSTGVDALININRSIAEGLRGKT